MARNPKIWEYLYVEPFTLRHHIAEYFLQNEDNVIDVGTYKKKLNVNGNLICIDPLMTFDDTFNGDVVMFVEEEKIPNNFSLCCIGCDIEGGEEQWEAFVSLFLKSKIAVIECPTNLKTANERINSLINLRTVYTEINLDLPEIKVDSPIKPNTQRRFLIFKD